MTHEPQPWVRRDADSPCDPAVPGWLLDDYLDGYVTWRAEYEAALDREEMAARVLREHFERILRQVNVRRAAQSNRSR